MKTVRVNKHCASINKGNHKHRDVTLPNGVKVTCPANQWWHVSYKGKVLEVKTKRADAIRIGHMYDAKIPSLTF